MFFLNFYESKLCNPKLYFLETAKNKVAENDM